MGGNHPAGLIVVSCHECGALPGFIMKQETTTYFSSKLRYTPLCPTGKLMKLYTLFKELRRTNFESAAHHEQAIFQTRQSATRGINMSLSVQCWAQRKATSVLRASFVNSLAAYWPKWGLGGIHAPNQQRYCELGGRARCLVLFALSERRSCILSLQNLLCCKRLIYGHIREGES